MTSIQLVRFRSHFTQGKAGLIAASHQASKRILGQFREAHRLEPLELSQIFTRFAVGAIITLWAATFATAPQAEAPPLLALLVAAWIIGIAVLIHMLLRPEERLIRRTISITADAIALSLLIHLGGRSAAIFFPIYLWMILGNGFRFGVLYMYVAMAINGICFIIMSINTPYWKYNFNFVYGVIIAIIAIPIYTSSLIRRLRYAMAEAKAAGNAKTEFLSMISHELRTPLNAILGLAQISKINAGSAQERQNAAFTEISANRLKRMLDAILKFQAIEGGSAHLNKTNFNLIELMAELEAILAPLASRKKLNLVIRFRSGIPQQLQSDPDILQTLILNIASNAIKYTNDGFVIVELMLVRSPGTRLRVEIHDSGPGIEAELGSRIFEQFTRHLPPQINDEGGVGLGLSLCKSLVRLMEGDIGFESQPGRGSSFWFEVPLEGTSGRSPSWTGGMAVAFGIDSSSLALINPALKIVSDFEAGSSRTGALDLRSGNVVVIADPSELTAPEAERLQRHLKSASHVPLAIVGSLGHGTCDFALRATALIDRADSITPELIDTITAWQRRNCGGEVTSVERTAWSAKNILVADDDQMNRQVAGRMLSLDGHQIFEAATGEEALDKLLSEKIDIAILDVNMPDLDGVEVCKTYLSSTERSSAAKLFGLTADISEPTRLRCLAAGMTEVLTKPLSIDELRASLVTAAVADTLLPDTAKQRPAHDAVDSARIDMLVQMFGEDALRNDLLPRFEKETASRIEHIQIMAQDLRFSDIRALLHAIKSSATTIGASQLARTVTLLDNDQPAQAPASYEILSAELNQFMSSCNELLERRA